MSEPKIIIVDDEEELRENLKDLLEFEGYRVHTFSSGEDALLQIPAIQPDLVLLDIQLPGIDGIEVLQRLKQNYPQWPVLIVSASSDRDVHERALRYGAQEVILKPYDPETILKTIEKYALNP